MLGDSARLNQVLMNFLSNAIKFTLRGRIDVRVDQRETDIGRILRVEVEDSGIGIRRDQLDTIFGRFVQADASISRRYGGTGLGLAICRKIIEAMGGRIGVESESGQGATFWFEVAMPVAASQVPTVMPEVGMAPFREGLKILVVDDNPINRELISVLLEPFAVILTTAADGVAAVAAAEGEAFDLILMDIQMPHMDGLTATRRIRAAEASRFAYTPIIAMTANVLPEEVARCLMAGMDDHIAKPIIPAKLLEAVIQWSACRQGDLAARSPPANDRRARTAGASRSVVIS